MQTISSYLFRIGEEARDPPVEQPLDIDYLNRVSPDLLVIERKYIATGQIGSLEGNGTAVAGYMNVGKYDPKRATANPAYDITKFSTTSGPDGSTYPDLTDPDWLAALKGEVDILVQQGFKAIYLDDILAYRDRQPDPDAGTPERMQDARAMIHLVNELVKHAPDGTEFIYNGAPYIRGDAGINDDSDPMWGEWLGYRNAADVVLADNYYEFPVEPQTGIDFNKIAAEFPNAQRLAIQHSDSLTTQEGMSAFLQYAIERGVVPLFALVDYTNERPAYSVTDGTDQWNDWVGGTAAADLLHGRGGSDVILGGAGDDTIYGGTGRFDQNDSADMISGGTGNDFIFGNGGNDTITGGNGNDNIHGGNQNDSLDGGTGNDTLNGGIREDSLTGGEGMDSLFGGAGFDSLWGNQGNDILRGGGQADNLFGGTGNDTMYGDQGFDRLFGGDDNDLAYGGAGTDGLFGQEGNDTLYGQGDDDRIYGGKGNDRIDGGHENDLLFGGAGFDTIIGSTGNDTMAGNFNADTFIFADFGGGFGQDTITDFDATNPFERIDLSRVASITDLNDLQANHMTQVGSDVVIDALGGNTIKLLNVNLGDLDGTDFVF